MGKSNYRRAAILICGLFFILLLIIGGILQPVNAQEGRSIQANFEAESLYLPLILKLYPEPFIPPTPTPTPPPGDHPQDGAWSGTTSRNTPMSFTVQSGGTQWSQFTLETDFSTSECGGYTTGTITVTVPGPGSISDNHFAYASSNYNFAGDFSSTITANGSYAFTNYQVIIGIPYPPYVCYFYLTQNGTWNASP